MYIDEGYLRKKAFKYRIYFYEFEAEFKIALDHESRGTGTVLCRDASNIRPDNPAFFISGFRPDTR
jgi:hypothetical protein